MSEYKVFVDDCGFKEYRAPYDRDLVDSPPPFTDDTKEYWRNNYFLLCAVRVDVVALAAIDAEIRALKVQYFGTSEVEIKSNWLRIPRERERRYIKPFGITHEKLNEFGLAFVELIRKHNAEIKLFTVAVDKRYYKNRSLAENSPLLLATQTLLERINHDGCTEMVFDQMETSKSLVIGKHKQMIGVYTSNAAVKKIYMKDYSNIKKVWFDTSDGENFLQMADICAYSVHRQLIEHGRIMTGQEPVPKPPLLSTYKYFEMIGGLFYTSPYPQHQNRVSGYGICIIPNPKGKELKWRVLPDTKKPL